jgi:hypothetical protein
MADQAPREEDPRRVAQDNERRHQEAIQAIAKKNEAAHRKAVKSREKSDRRKAEIKRKADDY